MTRDEVLAAIVAFDGDLNTPAAIALVNAAHAVLEDAVRLALDVCDALDNGTVAGINLPDLLAGALTAVAQDLPYGEESLVRHRPGCWEADHVRKLGMVLR